MNLHYLEKDQPKKLTFNDFLYSNICRKWWKRQNSLNLKCAINVTSDMVCSEKKSIIFTIYQKILGFISNNVTAGCQIGSRIATQRGSTCHSITISQKRRVFRRNLDRLARELCSVLASSCL